MNLVAIIFTKSPKTTFDMGSNQTSNILYNAIYSPERPERHMFPTIVDL